MKPKPETMWAIMGVWHTGDRPFLYTGTWLTRTDAIYEHSKGRTWKRCRKMGDRAIKVKVTPI